MVHFDSSWRLPGAPPSLGHRDVHLWAADVEQHPDVLGRLEQTLAPDETARADRFAFAHLRQRYVAARGILRDILARYTGTEPAALVFSYNPFGKPFLAGSPLRFNLAHSHQAVICAVTAGRDVGLDVEYTRSSRLRADLASFVQRTLAPGESRALLALPEGQQLEAFYNCWTRKEAYIKALGSGLSTPLDRFEVSLRPGEPARLQRVADHPAEAARWRCESFQLSGDYIAALMVEGQDWTSQRWRWAAVPPDG